MHPDFRSTWPTATALSLALVLATPTPAQAQEAPVAPTATPPAAAAVAATAADGSPQAIAAAIDQGIDVLLKLQEPGEPALGADAEPCQWPYEGVYRVRGKIPVGYRIGGTALTVLALAQ
ncbi:MAG: hypothetical protein NTV94_14260, partial [Planctomycetota bacterium]|nr:hypothetical protein [Planctomycetota bacterium]